MIARPRTSEGGPRDVARPQRGWGRQAARAGMLAGGVVALPGGVWLPRPGASRRPRAAPAAAKPTLESAAERLAAAVRAQWQAEAGLRGLHRPEPLRLTW